MNNFVAIDFETALGKRHSACAVGIVVVENNRITERFHTLIQPPKNEYHYMNTRIHGITPEMTKNEKSFDQIYPIICDYIHNRHVVCHNAAFDMDVLAKTMKYYNINDDLDFNFHCTLKLYGGGLKECCEDHNIPLNHHDPLSDAEACALLFLPVCNKSVGELFSDYLCRQIVKYKSNSFEKSSQYSFGLEACKAISTLNGILLGILMDQTINEKEIIELQKWTENQYYLIDHHPFKEFILAITEVCEPDNFNLELIEDMSWLCRRFEKENFRTSDKTQLQELQGIFHGILADGLIKDIEVFELEKWLLNNNHLSSLYPYDEICSLIQTVLKDGIIDNQERQTLKTFFYDFVELANVDVALQIESEISEVSIDSIYAVNPQIIFNGNLFCLTGTFAHGDKNRIEELIQNAGGRTKPNLVKDTKYLVVGSLGDPAWAFSCYGRKIEAALKQQKSSGNILIVHEPDFLNNLQTN